jgi:ATP-binding cassette, subfamily B, bacterial PglK
MLRNLKQLNSILKSCGIANYNFLLFLILTNSLFELVSLGALIPLIASLVDSSLIDKIYNFFSSIGFLGINKFVEINKNNFLTLFISFILFIYILKYIINLYYNFYLSQIKILCEKKIGRQIMKNFVNTSNFYFFDIAKSKILHDITSRLSTVSSSLINTANLFVESIIFFIIIIFSVANLGSNSIYYLLILIFLSTLFFGFYKKKAVEWSNERGEGGNSRIKNILDILEGIREIIIFGSSKFLLKEFELSNDKFLNPLKKILFWNTVPKIILEFGFIIFILSYFLYAIHSSLDYQQILISITMIVIILSRALPSINRILYNYSQLKYSTEPINSIKSLIDLTDNKDFDTQKVNFLKDINIKNIDFFYTKKTQLFNNLNLLIKKNKKVGIIGETGSGKSTLIDIISGLKNPQNGEILIDGQTINSIGVRNWIENISYVSQRVYLFNTSLRNNITFAGDNERIDEDKFEAALKFVDLKDLISEKKEKEFFLVGEFGKNVSGGQRQKIGIARAIYSNRPIIILDESTNSLDEKAEEYILDKIRKLKDKTIIFITHNKNSLKSFYDVYKIEKNEIIKVEI